MASADVDWAGAADAQEKALRQMDRFVVFPFRKLASIENTTCNRVFRTLCFLGQPFRVFGILCIYAIA